jgi:hypothetical protein
MSVRKPLRALFACVAFLLVAFAGPSAAQAKRPQEQCYILNGQRAFLFTLNSHASDKSPVKIHIVNREAAGQSGSTQEWQGSIQSALKKWTGVLPAPPNNPALPGLDRLTFTFTSDNDQGDRSARATADLIVVVQNFGDQGGLYPGDSPSFSPQEGYSGYVGRSDLHPPVVMLFPSNIGWRNKNPDRLRTMLLTHELGHLIGLRDLYQMVPKANDPRKKVRVHKPGYEDCRAVMFGWETGPNLQSGDIAGARAAYYSLMGSIPTRNSYPDGDMEDAPFEIPVDAEIPAETAPRSAGSMGGYVLDGYGGITAFGGASLDTSGAPYWRGWDIARALVVLPDRSGGWVLDGWGGIHAFGKAPPIQTPAYWYGWDIARDLVVVPNGRGGYMGWLMDGWGGLHAFNGAPTPSYRGNAAPYHAGQDSTVSLVVDFTMAGGLNATNPATQPTGGFVLERSGLLRRFGLFASPIDYHYTDARFPLLEPGIAWKKMALASGGWYVFGPPDPAQGYRTLIRRTIASPAPMLPVPNPWGAFDIIRDVVPDLAVTICTVTTPYCLQ